MVAVNATGAVMKLEEIVITILPAAPENRTPCIPTSTVSLSPDVKSEHPTPIADVSQSETTGPSDRGFKLVIGILAALVVVLLLVVVALILRNRNHASVGGSGDSGEPQSHSRAVPNPTYDGPLLPEPGHDSRTAVVNATHDDAPGGSAVSNAASSQLHTKSDAEAGSTRKLQVALTASVDKSGEAQAGAVELSSDESDLDI